MKPEHIVDRLLENDHYGPPAPDTFTQAVSSSRDLIALNKKKTDTLIELNRAIQIERQLRKHNLTKNQVHHYIRADQAYPERYRLGMLHQSRGALPPNAIVGLETNDGQKVMFDLAVIPEK